MKNNLKKVSWLNKTIIYFINNILSYFIFLFVLGMSHFRPLFPLIFGFFILEQFRNKKTKSKTIIFLIRLWFVLNLLYYFLILTQSGIFTNGFIVFALFSTLLLVFLLHNNLLDGQILFFYWLIIGYFFYLFYFKFIIVIFLFLTFVLMKNNIFKKEIIINFKKNSLVLSFLGLLIVLKILLFYLAYNGGNPVKILKKIRQQKEVKEILTFIKKRKDLSSKQIFYIAESSDSKKLFIGIQGSGKGLIMVDKNKKKIYANHNVKEATDNIYTDCKSSWLYVGDHKSNKVYYFNQKDITHPLKIFKLSELSPVYLSVSNNNKYLYVNTENPVKFIVVDLKSNKEVLKINNFGAYSVLYNNDLVASYESLFKFHKFDGNENVLKIDKEINVNMGGGLPFSKTTLFSVSEKNSLIFYPSFPQGILYVIDIKHSRLKKKLMLEKGIRFSNYNKKKDLVLVSGYVNGGLYIIDPVKAVVIKKLYVGPRARNISFSCDGNKAYVASAVGMFEINLKMIYKSN